MLGRHGEVARNWATASHPLIARHKDPQSLFKPEALYHAQGRDTQLSLSLFRARAWVVDACFIRSDARDCFRLSTRTCGPQMMSITSRTTGRRANVQARILYPSVSRKHGCVRGRSPSKSGRRINPRGFEVDRGGRVWNVAMMMKSPFHQHKREAKRGREDDREDPG